MRKPFDTAQGLLRAVFGVENNLRRERFCPAALAGNAKLFFKIRFDIADRLDIDKSIHKFIIKEPRAFVKR